MKYKINYIELDGSTAIEEFTNKKEVQRFIYSVPYNPIEKVERITKKETRDVTELFEIENFADSTESVEPEEYLDEINKEYLNDMFGIESRIEQLRTEIVRDMENISGADALIDILVGLKDSVKFQLTDKSISSWRNFYTTCIEENEKNIRKIREEPFSSLHQNLLIIEYKWCRRNKKALYILNEIETIYMEIKERFKKMTYSEASRAVYTACTEIANSKMSNQGKILSFDDLENSLIWWVYGGLIGESEMKQLRRNVYEFRQTWKILEFKKGVEPQC